MDLVKGDPRDTARTRTSATTQAISGEPLFTSAYPSTFIRVISKPSLPVLTPEVTGFYHPRMLLASMWSRGHFHPFKTEGARSAART